MEAKQEYTINDFNSTMTIFYNKRLGKVQLFYTGIQDFSVFADEAEDYELIWDRILVPYDSFVMDNFKDFIVDNNELCYAPRKQHINYRTI